jgi:hypothetical protein
MAAPGWAACPLTRAAEACWHSWPVEPLASLRKLTMTAPLQQRVSVVISREDAISTGQAVPPEDLLRTQSHYQLSCQFPLRMGLTLGASQSFCVLGEIPGKFRHAASHYRMLKEQRVIIRLLGKAVALSTPNCSN